MYITKKRREELRYEFPENTPVTPEELSWVLMSIVNQYLAGLNPTEPNGYTDLSEVIGVIECVKQETFRQRLVPYLDLKKEKED